VRGREDSFRRSEYHNAEQLRRDGSSGCLYFYKLRCQLYPGFRRISPYNQGYTGSAMIGTGSPSTTSTASISIHPEPALIAAAGTRKKRYQEEMDSNPMMLFERRLSSPTAMAKGRNGMGWSTGAPKRENCIDKKRGGSDHERNSKRRGDNDDQSRWKY
jgi:hypothetical protein